MWVCECVLLNIEIYYRSLAVVLNLNQLMFVMYVLEMKWNSTSGSMKSIQPKIQAVEMCLAVRRLTYLFVCFPVTSWITSQAYLLIYCLWIKSPIFTEANLLCTITQRVQSTPVTDLTTAPVTAPLTLSNYSNSSDKTPHCRLIVRRK